MADALRTGRLRPPYTALSLRQVLTPAVAEKVAAGLQDLSDAGLAADHLALVADIVLADRSRRAENAPTLDLVISGPTSPAAPTRDTSVVVRELFAGAERSVLVVGYAVHQGHRVFEALARRMEAVPDLSVRLCLDIRRPPADTSDAADVARRFVANFREHDWPGERLPAIYYDPRSLSLGRGGRASLHAKCIVVDEWTAFVSSANFTEAAHERNIEVGVLIQSREAAARLARHFLALMQGGVLLEASRPPAHPPSTRTHPSPRR